MIDRHRQTLLLMLLTSLEDAKAGLEAPSDGGSSSGKPGSRLLMENEVWRAGSYRELTACLDDMPLKFANALYVAYIWHPSLRQRRERDAFRSDFAVRIQTALEILSDGMPANLRVPDDVFKNFLDYHYERRR